MDSNKTNENFDLPEPDEDPRPMRVRVDEELFRVPIDPQTGEPLELTHEERFERALGIYNTCNADQKAFIDKVFRMYEHCFVRDGLRYDYGDTWGRLFNLQGAAGTGKSFALETLIELCAVLSVPVLASASTGIAATRIINATTHTRCSAYRWTLTTWSTSCTHSSPPTATRASYSRRRTFS